ncbi:hypothetical protein KIW84_011589 [Lathyrus oleraceus]|uniref:Cytochrome b561 domain-containing protein n=1 Tax=Pisum sativum TaxID=3888 RepID=A0A9D5BFD3_PEA|nr:hypothetical protein KIW84_011589 [Pisum sativum]
MKLMKSQGSKLHRVELQMLKFSRRWEERMMRMRRDSQREMEYEGGSRNSRVALMPWHVVFGTYIYDLAIVTTTTGLLEKATFLQTNNVISRYSNEAILVNVLGILIVALGGFVILGLVKPTFNKADVLRGNE